MKNQSTISLVLGSGGARGLAHIGIIHWLKKNGFEIASVSGCSMGSLVGGIYAAGKLDQFEQWICNLKIIDMIGLLDFSWEKTGLIKGDKLINALRELAGDPLIKDLAIPFTAVAADVSHEKEVWISEGNMFDAIRASISLPLFFTSVEYRGSHLIDGGVLNPVPIAPTFKDGTDMTIAVNLGGPVETANEDQDKITPAKEGILQIGDKINEFLSRLPFPETDKAKRDWGSYDVATQAFDAMQGTIARQKLAAYPPDHVIEIARNVCGTLEFDRAKEMIDLGYKKADEALAHLVN